MFYLNPWGIPGLLAGLLALALVPLLTRNMPSGPLRRRLTALLLAEAVTVVTSGVGLSALANTAVLFYAFGIIHYAGDALLLALYIPFLAHALDAPIARKLRGWPERVVFALGVGLAIVVLLRPLWFLQPAVPVDGRYVRFDAPARTMWSVIATLLVLAYGFGLIASLASWSTAQAELARRRARTFALAFGTRDFVWGGVYAIGMSGLPISGTTMRGLLVTYAISLTLYLLLLAYGVVTTQLFDIELKLKWTVRQGTIAAIFVAVFFFVSESATLVLSERLGPLVGIAAASLLILVLEPLKRFAGHISNAALPHAQETAEYAAFRKLQVYHAALESAYADGAVTPKERAILDSLCKSLGIHPGDAQRLEAELATGFPSRIAHVER